jgi:hypothetical protein
MEVSKQDLAVFYERQAARVLKLAQDCSDEPTQAQLVEILFGYIEKLETLPEGSRP